MPIENAFGRVKQILEGRPTRSLKQLRFEVRRAWNSLPDAYFRDLCNSMPDRVQDTLRNNDYPIGYSVSLNNLTLTVVEIKSLQINRFSFRMFWEPDNQKFKLCFCYPLRLNCTITQKQAKIEEKTLLYKQKQCFSSIFTALAVICRIQIYEYVISRSWRAKHLLLSLWQPYREHDR